jgi:hypothetical protein
MLMTAAIVLPRRNAFADEASHPDLGCEVSPKLPDGSGGCLNCPLPQCRYDVAGGVPKIQHFSNVALVQQLGAEGLSVTQIARQLNRSRRSIFRMRAGARG